MTEDPPGTPSAAQGDPSVASLEGSGGAPPKDVQQQIEEHEAEQPKKFGTFAGVFTPTLLTMPDVVMFLREGRGVGNAGLGGALLLNLWIPDQGPD